MIHKDFNFIVDKAKSVEKPLRVVIAGADAENILKGAFYAEEDWPCRPQVYDRA